MTNLSNKNQRNVRPWTTADDRLLRSIYGSAPTYAAICEATGRTEYAIQRRACKLGLYRRNNRSNRCALANNTKPEHISELKRKRAICTVLKRTISTANGELPSPEHAFVFDIIKRGILAFDPNPPADDDSARANATYITEHEFAGHAMLLGIDPAYVLLLLHEAKLLPPPEAPSSEAACPARTPPSVRSHNQGENRFDNAKSRST